jgi:hypothetical protein
MAASAATVTLAATAGIAEAGTPAGVETGAGAGAGVTDTPRPQRRKAAGLPDKLTNWADVVWMIDNRELQAKIDRAEKDLQNRPYCSAAADN